MKKTWWETTVTSHWRNDGERSDPVEFGIGRQECGHALYS